MKARELLNILNGFSEDDLDLDVQVVASGTKGRPVYEDVAVSVDPDEFDPTKNVIRFDVD